MPSTINNLAVNALRCRSGIPRLILRGEEPPKDLVIWIYAGLWQWIDDENHIKRMEIPTSWNQYLNNDYFDNASKAIDLVDAVDAISKDKCLDKN